VDTLLTGLVDFGAMGAFAGFLAWQFIDQRKQHQALVEQFAARVDAMHDKSEQAVEHVRDRYDRVIAQKDAAYERLSGKLESDVDFIRQQIETLGGRK
jgi:hypothetical protein